jgi:rod shape-determining protein MreC
MVSRRVVVLITLVVFAVINVIVLAYSSRRHHLAHGLGGAALSLVAPLQEAVTHTLLQAEDLWAHYFSLVTTAKENEALQRQLREARAMTDRCQELELANERLRHLLHFRTTMTHRVVAAEIIGKDSSSWSQTVIIDKGSEDGIGRGQPVVVPEGIAGQIIDVAQHYAKVLLLIDPNNAVDALVQRTRARGIVKGGSGGTLLLDYALHKDEIRVGDTIISSGLDGVYPKGLRVGSVTNVIARHAGMFQDVMVVPFVDFERLEEVLVVLDPPPLAAAGAR